MEKKITQLNFREEFYHECYELPFLVEGILMVAIFFGILLAKQENHMVK